MMYFVLFAMLSLFELASLILLFVLKETMHAVLSLTVAFSISALLFLAMAQPFLALMQLFIMVGGIATYLFVGVAAVDIQRSRHTNYAVIALLTLAFFAATFYGASRANFASAQGNILSAQTISSGLSANMALLFFIVFMLFGIGIGAMLLLRKI